MIQGQSELFLDSIEALPVISFEQAQQLESLLKKVPYCGQAHLWDLLVRSYSLLGFPQEVIRTGKLAFEASTSALESFVRLLGALIDSAALDEASSIVAVLPDGAVQHPDIQIQIARLELQTGAYADAAARCETILQKAPENSAARGLLLVALAETNRFDAAFEVILQAPAMGLDCNWALVKTFTEYGKTQASNLPDPTRAIDRIVKGQKHDGALWRGKLYRLCRKYDLARRVLEEFLEREPEARDAKIELGRLFYESHDWNAGRVIFKELAQDPNIPSDFFERLLGALIDSAALDEASSIVAVLPDGAVQHPDIQIQIARLELQTGAYADAAARCETILQKAPENSAARGLLLVALAETNRFDAAFEVILQAPAMGLDCNWALVKTFTEYGKTQASNLPDPTRAIDRIVKGQKHDGALWRGKLYRLCRKYDLARRVLEEFLEREPEARDAKIELGRLFYESHDWNAGRVIFKELAQDPNIPSDFFERLLGALIDSAALDEASSIVAVLPDGAVQHPDIQIQIARLELQTGAYADAAARCETILQKAPENSAARGLLLVALAETNRFDAAFEVILQAPAMGLDCNWALVKTFTEYGKTQASNLPDPTRAIDRIVKGQKHDGALWRGKLYRLCRKYDLARRVLEEFLEREPEARDAKIELGRLFYESHDWNAGRVIFKELAQDPNIPSDFFERLLGALIDSAALDEASSIVAVLPDGAVQHPDIQIQIARLELQTGAYADAAARCETILQKAPENSAARGLLLVALAETNRFDAAFEVILQAPAMGLDCNWALVKTFTEYGKTQASNLPDPTRAIDRIVKGQKHDGALWRGKLYRLCRKYDLARRVLEEFLEREPEARDAKIELGRLFYESHDWNAGRVIFKELAQDPNIPSDFFERLLGALIDSAALDEASSIVAVLPDGAVQHPDIQIQIARLELQTGAYADAAARCETILQKAPENSAARGLLLVALAETNRFDAAFEVILQAPAMGLDCNWALVKTFTEYGKTQASNLPDPTRAIDRIVKGQKHDGALWRGKLYRLCRKYDLARRVLEEFLEREPEARDAKIELGRLFYESHDWNAGRVIFKELAQDPNIPSDFRDCLSNCTLGLEVLDRFYEHDCGAPKDYRLPDAFFEAAFLQASNPFLPAVRGKIALIGATMGAGGAEHVLGNAHLGLQKHGGHDVELWLYSHRPELRHDFFLKELGIQPTSAGRCYPISYDSDWIHPFSWIPFDTGRNAQVVYQQILKRRPSVVHAWQDSTNLEVAFAGVIAGVPKIVMHPHNMRPDLVHQIPIARSFHRAYRAILTRPEVHLVCVSEASMREYLDWLSLERNERHHVVYNGFDWGKSLTPSEQSELRTPYRREFGIPKDSAVVGGIFRLVDIKRPRLWLEVAAQIVARSPDTEFLLFGDGPKLDEAKEYAIELGVAHKVTFAGRVSEAGRKSVAFDVLLHTSSSEGLPTVLLEAQVNGIPVVASDVGGVAETICRGHGALISSSEAEPYANAIETLLSNPPDAETCRAVSLEIRSRFSVEAMVTHLASIYAEP